MAYNSKDKGVRILDSLERYGPLSLGQIYTIVDNITPEEAQQETQNLLEQKLIEIHEGEPKLSGPLDLTTVYRIPIGKRVNPPSERGWSFLNLFKRK